MCGNLAHTNDSGNLVWINGGVAINKQEFADEIIDFQYYSKDSLHDTPGNWEWDISLTRMCWVSSRPVNQVLSLSSFEKGTLGKYIKYHKEMRAGNLSYV